ncbi:hypothetical protein ACFE04_011433 [Oxalis oulophora]
MATIRQLLLLWSYVCLPSGAVGRLQISVCKSVTRRSFLLQPFCICEAPSSILNEMRASRMDLFFMLCKLKVLHHQHAALHEYTLNSMVTIEIFGYHGKDRNVVDAQITIATIKILWLP